MNRKRYVIIGDGAAGTTAAQTIRQRDPSGIIEIYSDDPHPSYYRAALTNYLVGELREAQIWAVPPSFYAEFSIQRRLARVKSVNPSHKTITLEKDNEIVGYDELLIAAGSSARRPPFGGADIPGVMVMRTLRDVRFVTDQIKQHGLKEAVIVGGGPLAMEWVVGLHERGVKVHYLLRGNHLMRRTLDKTASDLTLARMRLAGVDVQTSTEVAEAIAGKDGRLKHVRLKNGATIPCELLGVAIGVNCNSGFLVASGVRLDDKTKGVVVDDGMRSTIPHIYAAGDIAQLHSGLLQLWEPAKLGGRTAGLNMTGGDERYFVGAHYNATRLYDLDFASVGNLKDGEGVATLVDFPQQGNNIIYKKAFMKDGRLRGAIMLGERKEQVRRRGRLFKQMIDGQVDIRELTQNNGSPLPPLLDPLFDLKGWLKQRYAPRRQAQIKPTPPNQTPNMAQMRGTMTLQPAAIEAAVAAAQGGGQRRQIGQAKPRNMTAIGLKSPLRATVGINAKHDAFLVWDGARHKLDQQLVALGRSSDENDVPVDFDGVSHIHAHLTNYNNEWYIRDAGSTNGTYVNGEQVTVPVTLQNGDEIVMGLAHITFETTAPAKPRRRAAKNQVTPEKRPRQAESSAKQPSNQKRKGADGIKKTTPVIQQPKKATMVATLCTNCGKVLKPSAKFCPYCGTQVEAASHPNKVDKLKVVAGATKQEVVLLDRTIIGRSPTATLTINDKLISGWHVEILRTVSADNNQNFYTIRDWASQNGTKLNGQPLTNQPEGFKVGDTLLLADKIEITFV